MSDGNNAPVRRPLRAIVYDIMTSTEFSEGEWTANLDALEAELADKVDAYAAVYRQLEAEAKAAKEVADYYTEIKDARDAHAQRLRQHMLEGMQRLGTRKVLGHTNRAFVHFSERVELDDDFVDQADAFTLARFTSTKTVPDKKALKEALLKGEKIERARLSRTERVDFK